MRPNDSPVQLVVWSVNCNVQKYQGVLNGKQSTGRWGFGGRTMKVLEMEEGRSATLSATFKSCYS
jgi:hypothetical protein